MVSQRLYTLMAQADLDGLVSTSFENVAYLSGAVIITQRMIPERLAAVVLPLHGDPTLVVCMIEEAQARRDSRIPDIRGYVEFAQSPIDAIAQVIREKGLDHSTLGIEMKVLSAHYFLELKAALPNAQFKPIDQMLDRVRAVKSPQEIERLQRAALATDGAIRAAYEHAKPGTTDKDVADYMANAIQASGADSVAFLVLGAGANAALGHPSATNVPLQVGDIVRCDVGGYYSGYYSDLARTAVVGHASPEQKKIYSNLWAIHEKLIGSARVGVRAQDLFFTCRDEFETRGMPFTFPHLGHSLGLGLHEYPILSPFDDTVLEEGMVLAIEPVYKNGGPIFHVEDIIQVTPQGGQVLSRSADWSELFVIGG
ncbi:MAG TPA: Xaa-Pro peptidase family protein [Anaerolineae bacterium]|nr:Xaa-Pro peptidase family protein [Anaerolineae bacterium]